MSATQHPAADKAPAKPAAAEPSTLAPAAYTPLHWNFPFAPAGKDDASDPMTYMKALGQAEDGFYPLGANGMWHGGVHFGQQTGTVLKQDEGVRAIADGEVVAYRLDSKYPELDYPDKRYALYSTGFVLVRHRLQLPPEPPKPKATEPAPAPARKVGAHETAPVATAPVSGTKDTHTESAHKAPPPDETLTFFSLYMHLLDWDSYQSAKEQAKAAHVDVDTFHMGPLPYWEGDRWYRVGSKATDKQETPKPKLAQSGQALDRDLLGEFIAAGFVVSPDDEPEDDESPPPPPVTGLRVRDAANGKIIGLLPGGTELSITETADTAKSGWARIATIKSGQPVGPVAGKSAPTNVSSGWVYAKELDAIVEPKPLDQVVVLKKPYPVKAGTVVGHVGQYLRYTDAKLLPAKPTRPMLHVEVFAGPDLSAFIAKSRARAKVLNDAHTFLEISPGALLVSSLPEPDQTLDQTGLKLVPVGATDGSRWVLVQPKTITMPTPPSPSASHGQRPPQGHHPLKPIETDHGSKLWVDSSLANQTTTAIVKGWKNFPLSVSNAKGPGTDFRDVFRRTDLDKLGAQNVAKDDKGTHWWNVTVGLKDGGTREGWVCEKDHPLARMCGPWDWPGFDLVDSTSIKPIDMFKRYLYVADQLLAGENKSEFQASATLVNGSDLITKLEKAVDANHDGKVTAQELAKAQQTPWMAEALSHLVVRCESEWGGGLGKWESLSPLMQTLLSLWKSEIERIAKLQWWGSVTGVEGFPTEPSPWHFHPIGLVGNFISSQTNSHTLILTSKDVLDLKKTLQTEWVQWAGEMQAKGVVDTILNRVASGRFGPYHKFGGTVSEVVNQRNQFSDVNGPISDKHGRSSVEQIPVSDVSQKVTDFVDSYLSARENGEPSSVGTNLNYANPHYSDAVNLPWINALSGPRYGSGKAIHYHGTTPGLEKYRPAPYAVAVASGSE
jgi:hypothetical protein